LRFECCLRWFGQSRLRFRLDRRRDFFQRVEHCFGLADGADRFCFGFRRGAGFHRPHGQSRVIVLLQPGDQLIHIGHAALVGDLVEQVGHAFTLGGGAQFLAHCLFEDAAHPHHALEAAVGGDELGADQVVLADAHHARRLQAAAGHAGQRAEGHARRRHARVLAADDHHAVRFGDEHDDALEATAVLDEQAVCQVAVDVQQAQVVNVLIPAVIPDHLNARHRVQEVIAFKPGLQC